MSKWCLKFCSHCSFVNKKSICESENLKIKPASLNGDLKNINETTLVEQATRISPQNISASCGFIKSTHNFNVCFCLLQTRWWFAVLSIKLYIEIHILEFIKSIRAETCSLDPWLADWNNNETVPTSVILLSLGLLQGSTLRTFQLSLQFYVQTMLWFIHLLYESFPFSMSQILCFLNVHILHYASDKRVIFPCH